MQNKKPYYHIFPWIDPEELFLVRFANKKNSFWLDSSLINKTNRFSYMGTTNEVITYQLTTNTTTITTNNKTTHISQDIFSYLDQQLIHKKITDYTLPFPFPGGFVGYFGYELKSLTGARPTKHHSPFPDSLWFTVKKLIVFDHKEKNVYLVSPTNKKQAETWFQEMKKKHKTFCHSEWSESGIGIEESYQRRNSIARDTSTPYQSLGMTNPNIHLARSRQQYLKDIETCKQYLAKGDAYELCLTNELSTTTSTDPLELYLHLRKTNPAPYSAYIRHNDLAILCSSPEEFLNIDKRRIETKPMKGTIKRGKTLQEDKKLKKQLLTSKKDWSENAMIVDLLRNDLGKVCTFGSVQIEKLIEVESYQTVHTLVSTITGNLRKNVSVIDAIKACFPGGSMTGAPKIRTMGILEELEKKHRGIYSGTLGYIGYNQTAKLGMVIRTMIIQNNHASIGTGGAILMDSDPEKEYQEMLLKAQTLVSVF